MQSTIPVQSQQESKANARNLAQGAWSCNSHGIRRCRQQRDQFRETSRKESMHVTLWAKTAEQMRRLGVAINNEADRTQRY
jgi:hypothetical protein